MRRTEWLSHDVLIDGAKEVRRRIRLEGRPIVAAAIPLPMITVSRRGVWRFGASLWQAARLWCGGSCAARGGRRVVACGSQLRQLAEETKPSGREHLCAVIIVMTVCSRCGGKRARNGTCGCLLSHGGGFGGPSALLRTPAMGISLLIIIFHRSCLQVDCQPIRHLLCHRLPLGQLSLE